MQLVAVYQFGLLPESEVGNSYILVAADYFTRWVEAYPIPSQEATTVARKLTDELFFCCSHHSSFTPIKVSSLSLLSLLRCVCSWVSPRFCTTPYHPQGNGLVERLTGLFWLCWPQLSRSAHSNGRSISVVCVWHITPAYIQPLATC